MDNTITALQNLYVAKGGELTTLYNGVAISDLVTIPDMINALAELETANAGGKG